MAVTALVAGGQTVCAASIGVVGSVQAVLVEPGVGPLLDVAAFESPDGLPYLLALGYEGIYTINVTDPFYPVRTGGISHAEFDRSWLGDAKVFYIPDGRVYAAITGDDLWILDVTDPTNPAFVDGALEGASGPSPFDHTCCHFTLLEQPDGRIHILVTGGADTPQIIDITDPHHPVILGGDQDLGMEYWHINGSTFFELGDGRTYVVVTNDTDTINDEGSDLHIVHTGIILLDVTDPYVPVPVGHILDGEGAADFGSHIWDVAILGLPGGRVHAAVASERGVTILNVTDPAEPVLLHHIRGGESGFDAIDVVHGMDVVEPPSGGTYLVAAGNEGIQVVNVTDPGAPVAAGDIPNESATFGNPAVFTSGDGRAYALGVGGGAVSMVDITDPHHPVPLGSIRDGESGFNVLDGAHQVEVLHTPDDRIYAVAAGREGLQVIEVTDPATPVPAGVLRNGTGGFEVGWNISTAILRQPEGGDHLLMADHDRGIHIVDVTDPGSPVLAGVLRGGAGGINLLGGVHDMDVFDAPDGRPYALMTGDFGIHTIDMADPATPVVVGTLDGSVRGAIGWDVPTIIHQSVVFEPAGGRIHALLADYMSGIHIVDLTDPRAPAYMGSVPAGEGGANVIPGSAVTAVASPNGRSYALVAGWDEIQILNITNPYAPAPVDAVPVGEGGLGLERTPWDIITMESTGGRIHALASGGDRLWVLDVTHPAPPVVTRVDGWGREGDRVLAGGPLGGVVGSVPAVLDGPGVGQMTDVAAFESPDGRPYLVVAGDSETVWVVDVEDPHRPVLTGAVSDQWFADTWEKDVEALEWPGGRAYAVVSGNGEVRILNVTDPNHPALVGGMANGLRMSATLSGVYDTTLFGAPDGRVRALALGQDFGLTVMDMTDPRRPTPAEGLAGLGMRPPESADVVLDSSGERVYAVAVGVARVYIADMTDPHRPALASVVRYVSDQSAGAGAGPGQDGGPAATVTIPPARTGTLPGHTEIRISGTDGAGLLGATGVAILEASDGRVYAAVANNNIAPEESRPQGVPTGIMFIDITDPSRPVPAGAIRDGDGGFGVGRSINGMAVLEAPSGHTYMAVAGSGDLWMLDVTDPSRPVLVGAIRDGDGGFDNIGSAGMAVIGQSDDGRLYLATVGEGIQLADVTVPSRPVPAGAIPDIPESFYTTGGAEYTAAFGLLGRTYALGTGGDGVHILDVTVPSRPVPAGSAWDGRNGFDTLDVAHRIAVTESPGGPFLALVAGDEGIQILDIVNPSRPVPAGAIRYGEGGLDPHWVTDMVVYRSHDGRDYLLVAGHYTGIHVVDITDPSRPVLAGAVGGGGGNHGDCLAEEGPDMGGVHGVDIYTADDGRDYALVACDKGIRILDMSSPDAPRLAGALLGGMNNHTFGAIDQMVLYEPPGGGIYALLADYMSGVYIVDVTDPHRPVPAGSIPENVFDPIPGAPVRMVTYGDHILALTGGAGGIHMLDVTDPYRPTHTGFLPAVGMGLPSDSFPWYIIPFESDEGGTYVLVDGGEGSLILSIPPHPPATGGAAVGMAGGAVTAPNGGRALALVGAGGTIYVGGPEGTIGFEYVQPPDGGYGTDEIVDLTDPYTPLVVGTVPSMYGWDGGIDVVNSPEGRAYAMVAWPTGLLVVDVDPADPPGVSLFTVAGGLAPDSPIEIFRLHDGRAYMAAGSGDGILIIDVTYPTNPVQISHVLDNLDGFYNLHDVRDISVFESGDGHMYVLAGSGDGIQIIDITNPYRPSSAGGMREFPGGPYTDGVHRTATVRTSDGGVLALVTTAGRIAILDVTNPHNPVPAGVICGAVGHKDAADSWTAECSPATGDSVHVPDVAAFETSDGRIRALITGHAGTAILDVTNPHNPVQMVIIEYPRALEIVSVFESSGGRPFALLAGGGDIWVGDLDDLTRLHDWGWP